MEQANATAMSSSGNREANGNEGTRQPPAAPKKDFWLLSKVDPNDLMECSRKNRRFRLSGAYLRAAKILQRPKFNADDLRDCSRRNREIRLSVGVLAIGM